MVGESEEELPVIGEFVLKRVERKS